MKTMKKKVFLAINLPEEIKKEISIAKKNYLNIPGRWVLNNELQVVVSAWINIGLDEINKIDLCLKKNLNKTSSFNIILDRVSFYPTKNPKMIWIKIKKSDNLILLKKELDKKIKSNYKLDPHITLLKINSWSFKKTDPEEIYKEEEDISINLDVYSLSLMESKIKKGKPEYILIKNYQLKK
jgi:2'-5' RNA ligase